MMVTSKKKPKKKLKKKSLKKSLKNLIVKSDQDSSESEFHKEIGDQAKTLLLPSAAIETLHWRVLSYFKTTDQYGGDWWGWTEIPRKGKPPLLALMIGDATGHGAASALVAATVRGALSVLSAWAEQDATRFDDPREILKMLNRVVFDAARGSIVMTLCVLVFDPVSGVLKTANAGHNFPYLLSPTSQGEMEAKALGKGGVALGHALETDYPHFETDSWVEGSKLFLYTDGLTEAFQDDVNLYDRRQLQKTLRRLGGLESQEFLDRLIEERDKLTFGAPIRDDLTVVVFEKRC